MLYLIKYEADVVVLPYSEKWVWNFTGFAAYKVEKYGCGVAMLYLLKNKADGLMILSYSEKWIWDRLEYLFR